MHYFVAECTWLQCGTCLDYMHAACKTNLHGNLFQISVHTVEAMFR